MFIRDNIILKAFVVSQLETGSGKNRCIVRCLALLSSQATLCERQVDTIFTANLARPDIAMEPGVFTSNKGTWIRP